MFHISIRQEEIQEEQDLWEETISCFLSLSGDLGIGLVWDNHLIPYNISVCILKSCSNYLWWVLSCSQNDVRCSQLFHRFRCSDDLRCLDMFSEDHKCWMLDFLQIFPRCSLDVLRMFWWVLWAWWVWGSGRSFGSSRSGGSCGSSTSTVVGLVGLVSLIGWVDLEGLEGLAGLVKMLVCLVV